MQNLHNGTVGNEEGFGITFLSDFIPPNKSILSPVFFRDQPVISHLIHVVGTDTRINVPMRLKNIGSTHDTPVRFVQASEGVLDPLCEELQQREALEAVGDKPKAVLVF